jgi:hypothetical protein
MARLELDRAAKGDNRLVIPAGLVQRDAEAIVRLGISRRQRGRTLEAGN